MASSINTDEDTVFVIDGGVNAGTIHLLEEKFDSIVMYEHNNVTVDLCNIEFLDSAMLSFFIRLRSKLSIDGRTLHLQNCSDKVVRNIRFAGLESYLLE